jgi:selenoprotein W-related protein
LTSKILPRFKMSIKRYVLIPSKGGCFELTVGGKRIYSKLETGEFPNEEELLSRLDKIINR